MATDQSALFKSLGDVASLINASSDLDATLHHLLEAACIGATWDAGGIMSVDPESGYAEVIARHDPGQLGASLSNRWQLSESPSLLAIERGEPIILGDARETRQFPGYRREAIEHGYATVVILPMAHRSAQGHRTVLSVRARDVIRVGPSDIAFLEFVVHLGEIAMNRARSLAEEQAFGERLRHALDAQASLLDQVLAEGSLETVTARAASMLSNPVVVVDLTARKVLAQGSPAPDLIDPEKWKAWAAETGAEQFLGLAARNFAERLNALDIPLTIDGKAMKFAAIICPLMVDGTRVGALIALSHSSDFSDLDHLLLESARFGLSVQMMRSYVANAAEARSQEDLFAEILSGDGRISDGLVERARRLGIRLDASAEMLIFSLTDDVALAGPRAEDARQALRHAARKAGLQAVVVQCDGALILWHATEQGKSPVLQALEQRLAQEIGDFLGERPVIQRSKTCHKPTDYAGAWQECMRIRKLARRFNRRGMVDARDFGSFPVLMSAVDASEMLAFVDHLLGAVLLHDRDHETAYIDTLSAFLDVGCRSQPCADALGLHVTTLRYRLARMQDLFGLTMETAEERFALQLALQFHRIITPQP